MVEEENVENKQPTVKLSDLPEETQKLVRRAQAKHKISEQYHQHYFGDSPPIYGVHAYGRMLVSVGGSIYKSSDPNFDWDHPSDFLVSYLKSSFGDEWMEIELSKEYRAMHEVAKWYAKAVPDIGDVSSRVWGQPNGKALAVLHLAYDLYVLESQNQLPPNILERLRNRQNFNGARYELFVFSTLLRGGFLLEYTDERSGLNGRVAECIAINNSTGQRVYVEAKTRNVKNVLGVTQGRSKKIRLYDKLKDAMDKEMPGPRFIFLDINHPKVKAVKGLREFEKIRSEYRKFERSHKGDMPNLVCFTNIPFHYGADGNKPDVNTFGFLTPEFPRYKISDRQLMELNMAVKKYDFLPKEFQEASSYADQVLGGMDE